jgi:hypothetical protein
MTELWTLLSGPQPFVRALQFPFTSCHLCSLWTRSLIAARNLHCGAVMRTGTGGTCYVLKVIPVLTQAPCEQETCVIRDRAPHAGDYQLSLVQALPLAVGYEATCGPESFWNLQLPGVEHRDSARL